MSLKAKYPCLQCTKPVKCNQKSIYCDSCSLWVHFKCSELSLNEFQQESKNPTHNWSCFKCLTSQLPFMSLSKDEMINANVLKVRTTHNTKSTLNIDSLLTIISASDKDSTNPSTSTCNFLTVNEYNNLTTSDSPSNEFSTLCLNIRSLGNTANFSHLQTLVASFSHKPEVIGITETWLKDSQPSTAHNSLHGYTCVTNSRVKHRGGGVALYINNNLKYQIVQDLTIMKEQIFESLFIKISSSGKQQPIICGVIYRSPNPTKSANDNFLIEMNLILKRLQKSKFCYIMGDFNYNLLDTTSLNINNYIDMFYSNSFFPLIDKPTRICNTTATLLDQIWTNNFAGSISAAVISDNISDHLPVIQCTELDNSITGDHDSHQSHFSYSDNNIRKFIKNLEQTDLTMLSNIDDPNLCFDLLLNIIQEIFSISFKNGIKTKTKRKNKIWFDKDLDKLRNLKQKLYRAYVKNKTVQNFNKYKTIKKHLTSQIMIKKKQHYTSLLNRHKKDSRATWRTINELLGKRKPNNQIPSLEINNKTITDPTLIANEFNSYFSNIASDLVSKLNKRNVKNFSNYLNRQSSNSFFLKPTTASEIQDVLKSLKNKLSAGIDGIPCQIVKKLPWNTLQILTHIFNLSFQSGTYITQFKLAKVKPLFKRGDKTLTCNYRPISLLSSFSKILEKLMHNRLSNYFESKNLFHNAQFGFRPGFSTELAALYVSSSVASDIEANTNSMGVFLDLSKAFDTIDHKIMLSKLNFYGIRDAPLKWFKSYLSNRTQIVEVDNCLSNNTCTISHGVPQGSILGPMLFIIYINDLPNCLESSKSIIYADDTTLLFSESNKGQLYENANKDLKNLHNWLIANKLTLNVTKTKYLEFMSNKCKNRTNPNKIMIGNQTIDKVKSKTISYLGIIFDENLTWKPHIEHVNTRVKQTLGAINKVRSYLNYNGLNILYHSMVLSVVKYGIPVWYHNNIGLLNSLQKNVQKFQNLVLAANKNDGNLSLTTVSNLRTHETAMFMYKYHNNLLPNCFDNYFTPIQSVHNINTRSSSNFHLPCFTKRISRQSIRYAGCKVWQLLPNALTDESKSCTAKGFSRLVKSFLQKTTSYS